jgi:IS30 family transposase
MKKEGCLMKAILKQVNIIPTTKDREVKRMQKDDKDFQNLELEYLKFESPIVNYLTSRIV